jgi:ectoine hydroxylase-related dioxygenase (phytanoyl-CoA dioxygenase family)
VRGVPDQLLTPELQERWETDGWCVIPRAIPPDQLAAAQDAVHRYFPTPAEMVELGGTAAGEWHTWDAPWPQFPFHSARLNALVLHDHVVDVAEGLLATADLFCYMGLVTAKYAHQDSGYNQLLHADYPNHMVVVPRHAPGFQQAEFFVYLTDVTPEDGATRFVSWQRTKDIPVERHTLNYVDYADLYEHSVAASAPAGSVVAYRPDVYHRSADHTDTSRVRIMIHVSFRHREAEWGGYQAWPFRGFSPELTKYVERASPRQLALLGIPLPGHAYWTEDTVAGVQARYPGLDMTPWRSALRPGVLA